MMMITRLTTIWSTVFVTEDIDITKLSKKRKRQKFCLFLFYIKQNLIR